MTQQEKIQIIGLENAIDTKDAFGKFLLLDVILRSMGDEKAEKFMADTLMMLDDEINELFKAYGYEEEL